jgi:hypothetical protein
MKVYQKKKKKKKVSLKKNGDDVITQKPMTSFKQVSRCDAILWDGIFQNKIDVSERFS